MCEIFFMLCKQCQLSTVIALRCVSAVLNIQHAQITQSDSMLSKYIYTELKFGWRNLMWRLLLLLLFSARIA